MIRKIEVIEYNTHIMNDKVSIYNIETEHTDCMLLYNALTDKLLPTSFENYAVIETLLEHLPEFSNDGNEYNTSYRVDRQGTSEYHDIVKNVEALREKYPD